MYMYVNICESVDIICERVSVKLRLRMKSALERILTDFEKVETVKLLKLLYLCEIFTPLKQHWFCKKN